MAQTSALLWLVRNCDIDRLAQRLTASVLDGHSQRNYRTRAAKVSAHTRLG
jgi:hypothetical protein